MKTERQDFGAQLNPEVSKREDSVKISNYLWNESLMQMRCCRESPNRPSE